MILLCFFNDTATTEIYTLSLHDALPISSPALNIASLLRAARSLWLSYVRSSKMRGAPGLARAEASSVGIASNARRSELSTRSEEHTSELQSRQYLVCRLLLEKKQRPSLR